MEEAKVYSRARCLRASHVPQARARNKHTPRRLWPLLRHPWSWYTLTSWGTAGGKKYVSKFTDHTTRWKQVCLIKSKDEALSTLCLYTEDVAIPSKLGLQHLWSDRGGEHIASYLRDFCKETGTRQEFTAPDTPQPNGVSERDGRALVEMTRYLWQESGLTERLWGQAISTSAYRISRLPNSALRGRARYSQLFGKEADRLRAIGARAFVQRPAPTSWTRNHGKDN